MWALQHSDPFCKSTSCAGHSHLDLCLEWEFTSRYHWTRVKVDGSLISVCCSAHCNCRLPVQCFFLCLTNSEEVRPKMQRLQVFRGYKGAIQRLFQNLSEPIPWFVVEVKPCCVLSPGARGCREMFSLCLFCERNVFFVLRCVCVCIYEVCACMCSRTSVLCVCVCVSLGGRCVCVHVQRNEWRVLLILCACV